MQSFLLLLITVLFYFIVYFRWIRIGLVAHWKDIIPDALKFINEQGRMKFVRPIYRYKHKPYGIFYYDYNIFIIQSIMSMCLLNLYFKLVVSNRALEMRYNVCFFYFLIYLCPILRHLRMLFIYNVHYLYK